MRVKEAASIVVNMPKKKHRHAKKSRVAVDTSGRLVSMFTNVLFFTVVISRFNFKLILNFP